MGWLQTLQIIFMIVGVASGIKGYRQAKKLQRRGQDILATKTADGGKLPVIYGTRRVGSTLLYMDTDAGNSKELFVVYGLSVGEIDDIDLNTIEINGVSIKDSKVFRDGYYAGSDKIASGAGSLCTASQIGKNTAGTGGQSGTDPTARYRMVFNAHHGSSTQTADPMLNASLTKWTSSHRLRGIAYIAASFEYDSRGMFSSTPELTVVCRGKKLYDPRLDGSISGGTGSHRINDSSTFEWSDNAALALLDYITNDEYGKGLAASTVNMQSFQTAADTADELVNVPEYAGSYSSTTFSGTAGNNFIDVDSSSWDKIKAGVYLSLRDSADDNEYTDVPVTDVQRFRPHTESFVYRIFLQEVLTSTYDDEGGTTLAKVKRFHCNGVIDTNENVLENTRDLLSNIRGFLNYLNGKYTVLIEDTASSVFSVNDDHIIDDQGIKIQYEDKSKKYNKVVVNFFNGQKKYEADTVTVFHDPNSDGTFTDYKDNDGGEELELKVEFDYITNPYIAYNMGKAILGRSRNQKTVSFLATPQLFKLSVGDVIDITYAGLGLSSDYYRIEAIDLLENGLLNIQAIEYINVYDWDAEPPEENVPEQPDIPTGTEALPPTNLSFTDSDSSASLRPYVAWNENTNSPAKEYRANCYIRGGANDGDTVFSKITNDTFVDLNFIATGDYKIQVSTITTTGSESDPATLNFTVSEPPITVPDLNFPIGGFFRLEQTGSTDAPNDAGFNSAFGRDPIDGDILIVIQTDATPEESQGYKYQDTNADGIADDFVAVDDFFAGDLIIDGTLGAAKIVAGSITGDRIAARTIGAGKIIANSLTAGEIAADAITTTELAADAVTADKIAAGTITATEIATGTLTSDSGVFGTISADDVTAGSLTSSNHSGTGNGSDFSTAGLKFNLNNGSLSAKNFRINSTGSAFFKGQVTAGTGTGTVGIGADADEEYNIFAGANNPESATFAVKNDGTVYLDRLAFKANNIVYFDENGFTEEARSDLLSGTGTTLSTYSYTSSNNTDAAVISTSDAVNVTLTGKLNVTQILGEFNRASEAAAEADIPANIKLKVRVSENSDFSGTDTHSSEQTFTADTTGTFIPDPSDGSGVTSTEYHVAVFGFFGLYQSSVSKGYGAVTSTGDLDFVANSGSTVALSADTTYYIRVEVTTTDTSYDLSNYPANTGVPSLSRAIRIAADSGGFIVTNGTGSSSTVDSFQKIAVSGQSTITSDATNANILTMAAGSGIALTTNASTDTLTIAVSGSPTFTNLTVTGDLTVQGTTTTLETATLNVEDKNITLNYGSGDTSASANGAGITIQDAVNSTTDATILWNTTSDRFDFSHGISLGDNAKATFGNSLDLEIYHDGSNSYIKEKGNGVLNISGGNAINFLTGNAADETGLTIGTDGAVTLYHDNSPKLATTSTGIDVTGTVTSDGLTVDGNAELIGNALSLDFMESDQTDKNLRLRANGGVFSVQTLSDNKSTQTQRLQVSHTTGDISFYEDTGTTAKLFWDASAESLGIGTVSPANQLHVASSGADFATIRLDAPSNTTPARHLIRSHDGVFDIRNSLTSTTPLSIDSSDNSTFSGNVYTSAIGSSTQQINIGYESTANYTGVYLGNSNSSSSGIALPQNGSSLLPRVGSSMNLGASNHKWNELYLSGAISSGAITANSGSGTQHTFTSASDAPIDVTSSDATTGIQFTDTDGNDYIFYKGSTNHYYTNSGSLGIATSSVGSGQKLNVAGGIGISGTTVIDSARALTNITTADFSTSINIGGVTSTGSSYLSGTQRIVSDGYIATQAIYNYGETGSSPAAIVFGNGSTYSTDQISLITSGVRQLYIDSGGAVDIAQGLTVGGNLSVTGTITGTISTISASTGAFSSNVNIDGCLFLDARYDNADGDNVLAFKDSVGNYSIRHNVNDGNGNYSISLGYSGTGNGQYQVTGDGVGKMLFGGHDTDGFISLNAATIGTAGTNISFSMGLLVDHDSIRVGASADGTGLGDGAGTQVFDASANAFATSYSVSSTTVIDSSRNLVNIGTVACGDITLTNNDHVQLYTTSGGSGTGGVDLPRGGHITFYGNNAPYHSIGSRDHTGAIQDDLRISSYGAIYIDLDSNDNNTGNADFVIGRHGDGTGTIATPYLFTVSGEDGDITTSGDITFYRTLTNDTGTILDSDGASNYIKGGGSGTGILYVEASELYSSAPIRANSTLKAYGKVNIGNAAFNGRDMLTLQTNDNASDRGIAFQNSGSAYSNNIFAENVGGNDARLVFTGGNATSLASLSRDFMINNQSGGGGVQGDIHARGDVVAFSTTVTSDERLKYDIQNIENPIEIIKSLTGRHFKWKKNDVQSSGVIAQEVEKTEMSFLVAEKCDIEDPNKTIKRVKYDGFIGVLIEAIKEQQEQIEELKAKLDDITN